MEEIAASALGDLMMLWFHLRSIAQALARDDLFGAIDELDLDLDLDG